MLRKLVNAMTHPILILGDELSKISLSAVKNPRIKLLKVSDTTEREVWIYMHEDEIRDLLEVLTASGVST